MPSNTTSNPKIQELFKDTSELKVLVEGIPRAYDALVVAACHIARKTGKIQEMVDYIQNENPSCSDLVLFFETIDDSFPKSFDE